MFSNNISSALSGTPQFVSWLSRNRRRVRPEQQADITDSDPILKLHLKCGQSAMYLIKTVTKRCFFIIYADKSPFYLKLSLYNHLYSNHSRVMSSFL